MLESFLCKVTYFCMDQNPNRNPNTIQILIPVLEYNFFVVSPPFAGINVQALPASTPDLETL